MRRKMMTKETVPNNSKTDGGNGSYMKRSIMKDQVSPRYGKKQAKSNIAGVAPAVARWMK